MANFKYEYTKEVVLGRLELEIKASPLITKAVDYLTSYNTTVDIYFKAELSVDEVTALDNLVAAHVATPLPEEHSTVNLDVPKDNESRILMRGVITVPAWHYSPRSLDFYTSKYNSLYNRGHDCPGNNATIDASPDLGDAVLKFYDGTNTLLTQAVEESDTDYQIRLTANCYKTVMEFEPTFDYDILGAKLQFRNPPSDRAYFWFIAAPDIPVEYGGSVSFMGGGMNISFFEDRGHFECDGKSVSRVTYDSVYHSGKVALIAKHGVGVQIGIQLILQFYSA